MGSTRTFLALGLGLSAVHADALPQLAAHESQPSSWNQQGEHGHSGMSAPANTASSAPLTHSTAVAASSAVNAPIVATSSGTSTTVASSATSMPVAVLSQCAKSLDGKLPAATPSDFNWNGNVRTYYVAAEEDEWNYAPTGWDNWLGLPLDQSPRAKMAGYTQYGTTWLKALYRGYTDYTFSKYSEQPASQGILGPTLRSEVGDMVQIMFVNKLSSYYATMHSMGLDYSKYNEGADYPNNTAPGENVIIPQAEAVPPVSGGIEPGGCVVYKWLVPPTAAPAGNEPSKTHSYHSYVALQQDTNAGLVGGHIVYAPGKMQSTMAEYREFQLLYNVFEEGESWLSGNNAARLGGISASGPPGNNAGGPQHKRDTMELEERQASGNETVWQPQLTNLGGSGKFMRAPSFYSMNGYVFANNPSFEMCEDDKVIWYVNSYGSASHVFHMHGNGFMYEGNNEYAISLNDGVGKTLYMSATDVGIWQVICHVANHQSMGMELNYRVYPAGNCPLKALASS